MNKGKEGNFMTKFENATLITLLKMKVDDLKNNPPKIKEGKAEELARQIDNIYHALICIDALEK